MKKPGWIDDFKQFIMRGNVLDMAVGVVIGGAFTAIVTGLVNSIINPVITLISGHTDFSGVSIGIFPIGELISAIINFLLIALVVFWMVRLINRASDKLHKKEDAEPEAPADPEPSNEEKLLTEIRDLLKEQNK
mgnify:CR=1 FL=1